MMAEEEDDIPPLEDMSELLEQAKQIQGLKEASSSSVSKNQDHGVANGNASSSASNSETAQRSGTTKDAFTQAATIQATKSSSLSSGSFGGMKKGFLFAGPSKKSTSSGKSKSSLTISTQSGDPNPGSGGDIPFIQAKQGSGDKSYKTEKYSMVEVQEALNATAPLLQDKEWVNKDLLASLEKHPHLAKQLADPRFAQAVHKFRSNPNQAMEEYKDDTEVQQFFKDFCALLGSHFSNMGGGSSQTPLPSAIPSPQGIRTQDNSGSADIKVRSSTNPKQATAADEAKMQQILSDPEIREVLMDTGIQKLIEVLRANPDQGHRILQSADPEMQRKIHKLVDAGLLGFAS